MTWYLRTRYEDPRRHEVRERHYLDNGEVWVIFAGERSLVGRFDPDQLAAARTAVSVAGLAELPDIASTATDLAIMTYEWQVDDSAGRWVDAAYPQELPDAVDHLEEALLQLEEAATPND